MANSDIIDLIIETCTDAFTYMLPIIGIMAGITYITGFLLHITVGLWSRVFHR